MDGLCPHLRQNQHDDFANGFLFLISWSREDNHGSIAKGPFGLKMEGPFELLEEEAKLQDRSPGVLEALLSHTDEGLGNFLFLS